MPLKRGKSQATISANIREFHGGATYARTREKSGKKRADDQAVAAALNVARKSGARIPRRREPNPFAGAVSHREMERARRKP